MLLDLKFSIGTLGLGTGALVAGLYGMNLKNFIEEADLGFIGVTASTFVIAAIVCAFGLHKLRRVQRVSMWGERGRVGGRGSWNQIEPGAVGRGTRAVPVWNARESGGGLGVDGSRNSELVPPRDLSLPVGGALPTGAIPTVSAGVAEGKSKQKRSSWKKHG